MNALLIMVVAFIGYILMYNLYGRFIGQKIFKLSKEAVAPSVELEDGIDYVPTKKEVIFGHHFTSIAGLPVEGIGLILGVDRLMDMIRTAVNVSGDAVVTTIVANSEGKMDIKTFDDATAGLAEGGDLLINERVERDIAKTVEQTHNQS